MATQPTSFTWSARSAVSGASYDGISSNGLLTAPSSIMDDIPLSICASSGGISSMSASVALEGWAISPVHVDTSDIGYYNSGDSWVTSASISVADLGWIEVDPIGAVAQALRGSVTLSDGIEDGWSHTYLFNGSGPGANDFLGFGGEWDDYNPANSTYTVKVYVDTTASSYFSFKVTGALLEKLTVTDDANTNDHATATDAAIGQMGYSPDANGNVHLDLSVVLGPGAQPPGQYIHYRIYQGSTTLAQDTFANGTTTVDQSTFANTTTLTDVQVQVSDATQPCDFCAWIEPNGDGQPLGDAQTPTETKKDVAQPEWTIERKNGAFATATGAPGATITDLAQDIGLRAVQYPKWLTLAPGQLSPSNGDFPAGATVKIPNTVEAYWAGWYGPAGSQWSLPFSGWGKPWVSWDGSVAYLKKLGFNVPEIDHTPGDKLRLEHDIGRDTRAKTLQGFYFWGHGYEPPPFPSIGLASDEGNDPLLYYSDIWSVVLPRYYLGLGLVFACYSNAGRAYLSSQEANSVWHGYDGVLVPISGSYFVGNWIHPGDQGTNVF